MYREFISFFKSFINISIHMISLLVQQGKYQYIYFFFQNDSSLNILILKRLNMHV